MVQVSKRTAKAGKTPRTPKAAAGVSRAIDGLLMPEVFKALSDGTRLKLLACLAKCGRACSVSEIAECTSVDLSVVSRHLAALADAGVLNAEKQGRTVLYSVRFAEVSGMLRALADALEECCPGGCTCCAEGGGCGCGCGKK